MKPLLQTLDSNESILLMYLADELPLDERSEVDALMQSDANLRAQLVELRVTHAEIIGAMESADAGNHSILPKETITRQTNKLLLEHVSRAAIPLPIAEPRRRRWLLIASGVAAALLIGSISYWGIFGKNDPDVGDKGGPVIASLDNGDGNALPVTGSTDVSPNDAPPDDAVASVDLLQRSLESGQTVFDDSSKHVDLAAAENEIRVVAELSDPHSIDQDVTFH